MTKISANNRKSNIYALLITLTLLLHVFNNLQLNESIKFFHLGAGLSLFYALFFLRRRIGKIGKIALAFVTTSFFSCILSPYEQSLSVWIKLCIIIGATLFVITIPIRRLVIGVNIIIPIALIALVKEYFLGVYYRYQGFYEDPNYMCTTLLVLFFYLQLLWEMYRIKIVRIGVLFEMLVLLFLVSTSISRTGLVCFSVMAIGFFWDNFLKNKSLAIIGALSIACLTIYFAPKLVEQALENYTMRETENSDTLGHASDLRKEISMRGVNFVLTHPVYCILGMGEGTTSHAYSVPGFHVRTHHGDHNTITCCFAEQGLVGFLLMMMLYYNIYKRIRGKRGPRLKKIKLISTVSLFIFIIFSMSINQMVYLPFWFMIFTLSNIAQNEDSAYSLLR